MADLPDSVDVAIVGAGLAGLSAARELTTAGRETVVLEASDGVGGRVRTDEIDGFLLDRGFQVMLTAYPELQNLANLETLDLQRFEPGAIVATGDKFVTLGDPLRRPKTLLSTALGPVGSPADKVRILRQRLRLQRTDPRELLRAADIPTSQALQEDGFSSRMVEQFFRPLIGGIQLDPSLETSRRMFDVILRTLIVGDAAVPAGGMGRLPELLAADLAQGTVHLDTRVAAVSPGRLDLADGRSVVAHSIVVATDGPTAASLVGIGPVESNPATCVWYAVDEADVPEPLTRPYVLLNGTGSGPVLNLAPMSAVAAGYAPPGQRLLAAVCPGVYDPDVEPTVRRQLITLFGPVVEKFRTLRVDAIAHGQPGQAPPFSPKEPVSLDDGIFVCGDHRDTASIQGAMYSGRRCGRAVVGKLGQAAVS